MSDTLPCFPPLTLGSVSVSLNSRCVLEISGLILVELPSGGLVPLVRTVPGELETNVGSDTGVRVVLIRGTVVVLATGSDVECRTSWELHMSPTLR